MRKFHNKSRLGCKPCKLRRIKCDEEHPSCRKCRHAGLECSFQASAPSMPRPPVTLAAAAPSPAAKDSAQRQGRVLKPKGDKKDNATTFEPLPLNTALFTPPSRSLSPSDDEQFGTVHLRLLRHFAHDFNLAEGHLHNGLENLLDLFIDHAWTAPYLMQEILAYAAAHRSTQDPAYRDMYLSEAKYLQTRALTLYNNAGLMLLEETCLPMFLFASLMGHHIIFEAALGVQDDLFSGVESLVHSISIHRGLTAIGQAAWPQFSEDTQQIFVRTCQRDFNPLVPAEDSRGEFEALLRRLEESPMDPKARLIYRNTVDLLQDRLNAVSFGNMHSLLAAVQDWLAAVPEGYIELLKQLQPEALVILAHFSVLLFFVSENWFVGDIGVRLVCLIEKHLGLSWQKWLDWPTRTIQQSLAITREPSSALSQP